LTPNATDNCTPNPTIHLVSDNTLPGTGSTVYTQTRIWNFTDDCGNVSANFTQVITVNDNSAPAANCPGPIVVNNDAGACNASVSFAASPTDNCGVQSTVYSVSGTQITSPHLFAVGTTTVDVLVT